MTGRTHDLAALTALNVSLLSTTLVSVTLATVLVAIFANLAGAIAPDLDQPTAHYYRRFPAGSLIGKAIQPLLGNHRMISHSLIGLVGIGWILQRVLEYIQSFLLVDMHIVWVAFMLGYTSHLIADTITRDGVPWLFPLPVRLGFPPFKFMRLQTGGKIEKYVIYPGLLWLNIYLVFHNYSVYVDFFSHFVTR